MNERIDIEPIDEAISVELSDEENISAQLRDINYIPGYEEAEKERRANELIREQNEAIRQQNETVREENETERKMGYAEMKKLIGNINTILATLTTLEGDDI